MDRMKSNHPENVSSSWSAVNLRRRLDGMICQLPVILLVDLYSDLEELIHDAPALDHLVCERLPH